MSANILSETRLWLFWK